MVNWNSAAVRAGLVIPLNLTVVKVTKQGKFRHVHLAPNANDLPPGFEAKAIVLKVLDDTQDLTVAEANQKL